MPALFIRLLSLLVPCIPGIMDWLAKRKAAKAQAEAQARADAIRADPAAEFLRKFNGPAKPGDTADKTESSEPPDHG